MRSCRRWLAFGALVLLAAGSSVTRSRVKAGGIEFSFELPSDFQVGRFTAGDVFPDAAVLVESSQLGDRSPSSIPAGEVPVIFLDVKTKDELAFLRKTIPNFETYCTRIEGREVWKLPAFPGAFGDQMFCYIVPIGMGGRSLEIVGHRHYRGAYGEVGPPTHYDAVIERIIATLAR
jgi:hypothetical protein